MVNGENNKSGFRRGQTMQATRWPSAILLFALMIEQDQCGSVQGINKGESWKQSEPGLICGILEM